MRQPAWTDLEYQIRNWYQFPGSAAITSSNSMYTTWMSSTGSWERIRSALSAWAAGK